MTIQHHGSSVRFSAAGELDETAGEMLQRALEYVAMDERDLLVDLHGVTAMDTDGLLHLLDLHQRAEHMHLRVQVTGWQPQPQQHLATVAGIPGPRAAAGDRYAQPSFRRLLESRAQRERDNADLAADWLPPS
ncbi:STAS domain-containing protein [Streptomyces sp. NPDC006487]|uniref:STAS domain-containing protein n=1 Tax=Streptomyces sp. NPDC006487 TaxID=3364748 RepID=UPI003685DB7E